MIIEKNGNVVIPQVAADEWDLMESLDELKIGFKDFVFNYKVVKYFGIDLLWQQIEYR